MKLVHLGMAAICLATVIGCGKGDDNSKDGNCGQNVIDAYNDASIKCKYAFGETMMKECKVLAQNFVSKYPNASCEAKNLETGDTMTVSTSNMQTIVDVLIQAGY